jgi:hypothetical protein
LFFHDRHQHIDIDGNPNLGFHRVIAGAVKMFDAQVLLIASQVRSSTTSNTRD